MELDLILSDLAGVLKENKKLQELEDKLVSVYSKLHQNITGQ